jgi:hypothetical protein
MIQTKFFDDFLKYYEKAQLLQTANLVHPDFFEKRPKCDDPLMDSVTIYDTINRKFAGFSKVLEDIHGVRVRKDLIRLQDYTNVMSTLEFHFLHLLHRFTGSGASFQPRYLPDGTLNPKEHGYCNNVVGRIADVMAMDSFEGARETIVRCTDPMVSSTGNQPPSLKNGDPSRYRLAMQYYFDNFAQEFVSDYLYHITSKQIETTKPVGIKEAVDFCLDWHSARNFKRWHFVLTAFVMDTAEYYPELVDPKSHCYYGANCVKGFDLAFEREKSDPKNKAEWYEKCMAYTCDVINGRPYDVEDCYCDYIRYIKEYIPKGYDHLIPEQRRNNSILKINGKYPEHIKKRILEICG